MTMLFIQNWDILPGKEDEYTEFIAKKYIPKCDRMGLMSVGGYYVEVGQGPRFISVKRVKSGEELATIMGTQEFRDLVIELKELTFNYSSKILQGTGKTRDREYEIQKGVWKYNLYFDVRPGMRKQYREFVTNKYLPMLNSFDFLEVTGGWNIVIGGTTEKIGEHTFKDPVDIARLLNNPLYRELTHNFKRDYVTNFSSKILRTTERFEEPRWFVL